MTQARLVQFLKEHREQCSSRLQPGYAKLTFGTALEHHLTNLEDRPNIKLSTVHYWKQISRALLRSWPGLELKEIRRITTTECENWATTFRIDGESVKAEAETRGDAWHRLIGIDDVVASDRRDILLIPEGSNDALAALHFADAEGTLERIGVVAIAR